MKRYDEYIEINSPWIKNIPMNWNAKRLKSVAAYISRGETPVYTDDTSCTKVINQATFSQGYWNTKKVRYTSSSPIGNESVPKQRDVLLASTGRGVLGKVFYFDQSDTYIADSHVTIIRTCETLNSRFLYYYLSVHFDTINGLLARGSTNQTELQEYSLKNMPVPLPSADEQDQIVRYLDWQVSKINRLIAAKRKEIDAIHDMEHLYIDHVFSEIANQKTIRLKYLVEQFVDCPHETPEYCKDGDYCVIRTADQDYGYLRSETLMYRLTESEYTNRIRRAPLNAGDIVYGREGERWGLACVIPESEKFCLGQRIMQFVCNRQMVTPEYVMWALNSSYVRNQGILDTMGSTSPHVNISTIINFRIPYTSREHQHTLVSKIECTMQKYRQLCERIENEIQLLHDLRTRLISDVVTGQVDVRGIKVPDDEYINNEITEEEFEETEEN